MTVTIAHIAIPDGGVPVPYTVVIEGCEAVVRYQSVIDPDRHWDVVTVPHGGEPSWAAAPAWEWSDEAREAVVARVRQLLDALRPASP